MYRDEAGRFGWNDIVNGVKKAVKTVAKAVDKYIVQPVVKTVKYVANAVGNFVSNVFHSAQQVYNQAASYASQGVNYVSNQVQQGYNQAVDWAATKATQAQAAYQQAVAIAQETRAKAEARIRKMCEGASAVWNSATKAVDNFVKKHEREIKLALGAGVIILSVVNPPAGLAAGMALSTMELGSAVTGKDWVSNREMSDKERLTTGVLSVVSMGMGGSAIYNEVKSVSSVVTTAKGTQTVASTRTTTKAVVESASKNVDEVTDIYRSVGVDEYTEIMGSGKFQTTPGMYEGKQFANNADEALKFADWDKSAVAVIETKVPKNVLDSIADTTHVDRSIFPSGTLTIPKNKLDILNDSVLSITEKY